MDPAAVHDVEHGAARAPDGAPPLELGIEHLVAGGSGLAHEPSGRVVLVDGGLPGEVVRVRLVDERERLARGRVESVVVASPDRVDPPCPMVAAGCGGCDLQHAAPASQPALKAAIVRDALARPTRRGELPHDLPITIAPVLPATGFRTTVRAAVVDGRAGFHARRSDDVVVIDHCLVAHPLVDEVLAEGRFPGGVEVTIRVGARTGERLVVVSPAVGEGTVVPADVRLVGADELRSGRRAWIHEEVAGRRFRISAPSFFQARPDGAEALLDAVARAIGPTDPTADRLVDLYGGVGLFAAGLGWSSPVLVERSASSVADARRNLDGVGATVVRTAVERWHPSHADVVVADPARSGLGRAGVRAVAAVGARAVALVSCDPAAMARDLTLLRADGYEPTGIEVVDLFPHTHHVEAVTALVRA